MSPANAVRVAREPLAAAEPAPPPWVEEWLADPRFSLDRAAVQAVDAMDILTLQQSVADAYRSVFEAARESRRHPVRLWAFIPRIHADHGNGLDRYMVFNAGRYAACTATLGGREALSQSIPTASAVGWHGPDLLVYCLTSELPGQPVENPRQVPAYRYSKRFGPLPPCFARATLLEGAPGGGQRLLVGGTASICGEESMHLGELDHQLDETLRNLASLVAAAGGGVDGDPGRLASFRELRVYFREPAHRERILERLHAAFPSLRRLDSRHAELCRRELLVEIEGLAQV